MTREEPPSLGSVSGASGSVCAGMGCGECAVVQAMFPEYELMLAGTSCRLLYVLNLWRMLSKDQVVRPGEVKIELQYKCLALEGLASPMCKHARLSTRCHCEDTLSNRYADHDPPT